MKKLLSIILLTIAVLTIVQSRPVLAADLETGAKIFSAILILPFKTQALAGPKSSTPISGKDFIVSGVEKAARGELQQAIEDFTQAIALDSNLVVAYSNRCFVYIQLEDYQHATEDCTQALQRNPKNAEAYLNRGVAHYRQGRYQAAVADYNQLITQLNPVDHRAYYNRGLVRFEQKDYQGAIAD